MKSPHLKSLSHRRGTLWQTTFFEQCNHNGQTHAANYGDSPSPMERGPGGEVDLATIVRIVCLVFVIMLLVLASTTTVFAQDDVPPARPVTLDDINAIAGDMFCPECEALPLDKCGTTVCVQWKDEIARQLADGRTEEQIIDYFVANFGDQVLGIPQDPLLRNLSLIVPLIGVLVIFIGGTWTYLRLRGGRGPRDESPAASVVSSDDDDPYRSMLEQDLQR